MKEEGKSEISEEGSKPEHEDNDDITEIPVPVVVHPVVDVHESDVENEHEHDSITLNESKDDSGALEEGKDNVITLNESKDGEFLVPSVVAPSSPKAAEHEEVVVPRVTSPFDITPATELPMVASRLTPPPPPSSLLTRDVTPPPATDVDVSSVFSPAGSPGVKSPSPEKRVDGELLYPFLLHSLWKPWTLDGNMINCGRLERRLQIRILDRHTVLICEHQLLIPDQKSPKVGSLDRQPGLLCTPRNFAQSSKFLGKKYFSY